MPLQISNILFKSLHNPRKLMPLVPAGKSWIPLIESLGTNNLDKNDLIIDEKILFHRYRS